MKTMDEGKINNVNHWMKESWAYYAHHVLWTGIVRVTEVSQTKGWIVLESDALLPKGS